MDVAIAGAGFGGLALAALLGDAGLRVVVLERRPALMPEGVGLVVQPNGLAALDRLGVVSEVVAAGERIDRAEQRSPSGHVLASASYAELDHPHPYLVPVERSVAVEILAARLPAAVSLRFGCAVERLVSGGVAYVDGAGGSHVVHADCVVGADGRNSVVRRSLGVRLRWRTGPDPYVIGIVPGRPADDAAILYSGDGWCDGVMPLRDRTYWFDHVGPENEAAVAARDVAAWRDVFVRRLPEAERIASHVRSFDDVGVLSGRTHRAVPRVAPGVALVGDAAAAVHPHNGQGANLALEDAVCLADAFARHGVGSERALSSYARERDAKLRLAVPWSIFIGRTFDGPNPGWKAMRRVGYAMARIPPIRRQTTRRQAGLA